MKNLILGVVLIFTLTSCASKKDFRDMTIEEMKKDCEGKDQFKSCYRLGREYLKNNDINLALTYYSKGCYGYYEIGFINKKRIVREDIYSCVKEAEILKDKKEYKNSQTKSKLIYVADYYFKNNDFTKAYEYYENSLKYQSMLFEQEIYSKQIFFNMSQILLKGTDKIQQNIKLSELYYIKSLQYEIYNMIRGAVIVQIRLNKIYPRIEVDTEISADGKIINTIITTIPKDENISSKVYKLLQEYNFNPIPKEYNLQQIKVERVILKTNANQK
ncbi:hypothetical protein ACN2EN_03545 [Aliarcobacter lanthieri]|uniref:hypothetical protein n=1 Tax=Aliarcobacter lanthieri TaxID=1355374 RepID=UPI00047EABBE|nr:hypothetical protein [Aliarcobacter lanthieri]